MRRSFFIALSMFVSTGILQASGSLSSVNWGGARWVRDSKPSVAEDSLYGDNPAPVFSKEMSIATGVRRATLYISGVGYYEAKLNGKKIGDHWLDPGWTDFRKTIYYNTYDVTGMLRSGANSFGVELGNGWYNSLPLKMWGGLNMRKFIATGQPQFIAKLVIEYADGHSQEIVSDGSWKVKDGPWRRNNNYIGSTYDGRYVSEPWRAVTLGEGPGGELVAQEAPPIRAGKLIKPVGIRSIGAGKYIVDLGRNFAGIIRMSAEGASGTRIHLRYSELLRPDGSLNVMTSVAGQVKRAGVGGPGAPAVAWQEDYCILGDAPVVFEPAYTFHGFRYVEVEGYPGELTADKIAGIPLSSDVETAGQLSCGNDLLNKVQAVSLNTFKSNLFSVQSDCPHREKLGYGGDIVATSEAFMTNYDMHAFYAKTVRDFVDAQQPDGALTETAPYVGIADGGVTKTAAPIAWGTVLPLLLWQEYQYYGDVGLIRKYYAAAKKWVDFLHAHAPDHIITQCIGDHESLDQKQLEVTSTAYLYYNTQLLSKLASVLGFRDDVTHYGALADVVRSTFVRKFYNAATGEVGIHTQANQAFALYFHLLPASEEEKAMKVLLAEVASKDHHISTGIFGTKYLLEVLSERGHGDVAGRLALAKGFPGWSHMLDSGATTLWEHWEYSDNTFSHNHPMFGSISSWMHKYVAGIRPDTNAVGFNKIVLQPGLSIEGVNESEDSYRSPFGIISLKWKKVGDSLLYECIIPSGVDARVILPGKEAFRVGAGRHRFRLSLMGGLGLIPYPVSLTEKEGRFVVDKGTRVVNEGGSLFSGEEGFLRGMLSGYFGVVTGKGERSIVLKKDASIAAEEGYKLDADAGRMVLSARTSAGMFNAIATLRQLLPAEIENGHGDMLIVPGVHIEDQPRFPWRGMMLDVSRHFFSMAYLRKYIDMMALYKLNKFHLHLTDDQGWRIEIKKYPKLAEIGGWRHFNDQDSICMETAKKTGNPDMEIDPAHIRVVNGQPVYGGSYTQEEIKSLIAYAAARHIEIIPEIDMPGHMMAAIALYPELTCDGQQGEDWTKGFSTPICPCRENVLEFAKDIFSEIAALFPSKYIHIGGDEVERSWWKKSPLCAEFMKAHHIETLPQLQSYFNDYMQAFFRSKGKVLMGWDEIVEGGIDSTAAVMFWRTWAGTMPARATANGNKVVMTADGPLYFDAAQDRNSLGEVYHYDPLDAKYGIGEKQKGNILGVQGNLWTEWIPTEARADHMIMPRMSALAELGWTYRDRYDEYLQRLGLQYDRLDRMGVRYRLPDLGEAADRRVFVDTAQFMVKPPLAGMTVHYTTDGSWPVLTSPVLEKPLLVDRSLTLKMAAFSSSGRRGDIVTTEFSQQGYAKPVGVSNASKGLSCDVYNGSVGHVAEIYGKRVVKKIAGISPVIPEGMSSDGFGLIFRGFIEVPAPGIYSFYLNSDDGSMLHIADRLVVDNDGTHSSKEKVGQVALEKGRHAILLEYFDGGGGSTLSLRYSLNGSAPKAVPADWFSFVAPAFGAAYIHKRDEHPRIVNIVNFIRWVEPRDPAISHDVLYQTVVRQIELMKANRLGGTFLLQYDALIDPQYQQLLKGLNKDSFEVGAWWELPQQLVEAAGLKWRGRYSWDWRADVGFSPGYSVADRKRLVDAYMKAFKKVFGAYPRSVASWYIDAYTLDYMQRKYGIRASANCKDQVGTDGYTLWGGYWNQAYYPSRLSAYMPAQHAENQIPVPVFRMLGSDPIRQYESGLGTEHQAVVTLEPVYPDAGGDSSWVQWFLKQLVEGPSMAFGYTQAGQENSFTWNGMHKGLEMQFPLIAQLRDEGKLRVETLAASGEWFRSSFPVTPATAVTALEDLPGQNRRTVWFNSRFYRANWIWEDGHMRCRDIHRFDERMGGDSTGANAATSIHMYTIPVVDGFLWSKGGVMAGLKLMGKDGEFRGGNPVITDSEAGHLSVRWPLDGGGEVVMELTEGEMRVAAPGEWWMEWADAGGVKSVKRPENGVVRWELSISL